MYVGGPAGYTDYPMLTATPSRATTLGGAPVTSASERRRTG